MRTQTILLGAALAAALPVFGWEPWPVPQTPAPAPAPAVAPVDGRALVLTKPGGSYLGIGVAEITSERAKALNLREEHGVEITRVEDESPAAKAGMKPGDVVLEYNGQRIEGVEQFMRMVRETPAGRDVRLAVSRGGSPQNLVVRTGSRKNLFASRFGENAVEIPRIEMPAIRMPDVPRMFMTWRSGFLGIDAESLDSQLAEYFGVKEGVLVRSVSKGSPAEKAGLRAGDVIVRIDDKAVSTPAEVTSAVRTARANKSVTVGVVREKRETSVVLSTEDLGGEMLNATPRAKR
jgi:serine protease Do